jgi:hypothetical protein
MEYRHPTMRLTANRDDQTFGAGGIFVVNTERGEGKRRISAITASPS